MSDSHATETPSDHPFLQHPHRTLLFFTVPALLSLVAEPLTGLVDTAFIARLGEVPLAALGVGTTALSSIFWIFNFLGIGTQTEVAQAIGRGDRQHAVRMTSLAMVLGMVAAVVLIVLMGPGAHALAQLTGGSGAVEMQAVEYIRVRLLAAPAVLITLVGFGALRGLQDMRTPLWIAVGLNAVNIALDPVLIFGAGPIPAMGITGGALATALAQWMGAGAVVWMLGRRLGYTRDFNLSDAVRLLTVGGDLFIRTGLLVLFMLLTTRLANQIGASSGAAHQVIRQVWTFTALALDAFAMTAQSLVGYFYGPQQIHHARRAARLSTVWAGVTGLVLAVVMLALTPGVIAVMVPESAVAVFVPAWIIGALIQPMNALAFVTDGIHWATQDYRFLRNAMLTATLVGGLLLAMIDLSAPAALSLVWLATAVWISIRTVAGILRVWPGIGAARLVPVTRA